MKQLIEKLAEVGEFNFVAIAYKAGQYHVIVEMASQLLPVRTSKADTPDEAIAAALKAWEERSPDKPFIGRV